MVGSEFEVHGPGEFVRSGGVEFGFGELGLVGLREHLLSPKPQTSLPLEGSCRPLFSAHRSIYERFRV